MSTNKNTARQNKRRAKRSDAEIKPLAEAARSGLFRFLNAAQKYAARRKPGFVQFEKPNIVQLINDET